MKHPMDWLKDQVQSMGRGEFLALLALSHVAGLMIGVAVLVYLPTWAVVLVLGALIALLIGVASWAVRHGARPPWQL